MKLVVALVLLVGLLVVGDRVAASATEGVVAERLQESGGLSGVPDVEISGFPFLTQALTGRYDDVVVHASSVQVGDVQIADFTATAQGLQVPITDALSGSVSQVPVDELRSRAVVSYEALSRSSGRRSLTVRPFEGGRVRVTGEVEILGRTLRASSVSRLVVDGPAVVVTAESYDVGPDFADELVTRAIGDSLDLRLPIGPLPYGLQLSDVRAGPDGVIVTSAASDVVLTAS